MGSKKKLQLRAKLLYNKQIKPGFWRMGLSAAQLSRAALPGQFINVKISGGCEPLLRRPFSIHRLDGSKAEIIYEVVGKATQILSYKKSGEYLDVIGPLGSGFSFTPQALGPGPHVLVAGGLGVAPLLFLAEKLAHKVHPPAARKKILVLLGARNKNELLREKEFNKLGCVIKAATDDGSKGFKGRVTELLKCLLSTIDYRLSTIYSCGPKPMLKEVSRISWEYKIPAQISLEEHMSCGIGACMGCVVRTKNGYKRVCKEGPVFDAKEIIWEAK